ncbi:MAG TPA: SDR family NAD(P)-dependent oxidoreductase [Streptosporangiaceae bacterium]|nr:SDR family NAD(P)-dependent oxidoreductase [Streptosporangiaceae bacterium]
MTGASRGIGAEIARRFGAEGAAVAVSARTTEPGTSQFGGTINETAEQIRAKGGTAIAIPANLARPEDREQLVSQTTAKLGTPDILVNNAAVTYFKRIEDFTPKQYALMFDVQVVASVHLATLVIPGMRERGAGWILNISSIAAVHPQIPPGARAGRDGTVYGMCKAAIERFSTGLAAELYNDNIAVNSLAPNKVVPTPGTLFHQLTTQDNPNSEPPGVMAAAALALCSADPMTRTGRIAYSIDLLTELGEPIPARRASA